MNVDLNKVYIDGKFIGKSDDFAKVTDFNDISNFMLENLESIFDIIKNNGQRKVTNHKVSRPKTNKNLGPIF